jgi:hypothetical protein
VFWIVWDLLPVTGINIFLHQAQNNWTDRSSLYADTFVWVHAVKYDDEINTLGVLCEGTAAVWVVTSAPHE